MSESLASQTHHTLLPLWQGEAGGNTMSNIHKTELLKLKSSANAEVRDLMAASIGESVEEVEGSEVFRHCIVHPDSVLRNAWDITSILFVFYDLVMIPLQFFSLRETTTMKFFTWTTRLWWTFDMAMSAFTGFVTEDGSYDMKFQNIWKRYLRSWFCLDLFVVTNDWSELFLSDVASGMGLARFVKVSRIVRGMRMLRLLRLARMSNVLNRLIEQIDSQSLLIVMDVMKLLFMMLGWGHIVACVWYGIGDASGNQNWLDEYKFRDRSFGICYLMSLRWAVSQFSGGMDEVTPQNKWEHTSALIVFIISFWAGTVFLSILTSSMTQWYIIGSKSTQQLCMLRSYLSQNHISKSLSLRIRRNAQFSINQEQRCMLEPQVEILGKLSKKLLADLHYELYSPILCQHPFFSCYARECPEVLRKVCHNAVQKIIVHRGETVFNVGESPVDPKMFFVTQGVFGYMSVSDGKVLLREGMWVSEAPLWVPWVHRGLLVAVEDSELCTLDVNLFHEIVVQFEHIGFDPQVYAQRFVNDINLHVREVTDISGCREVMTAQQAHRDASSHLAFKTMFTRLNLNRSASRKVRAWGSSGWTEIESRRVSEVFGTSGTATMEPINSTSLGRVRHPHSRCRTTPMGDTISSPRPTETVTPPSPIS